VVVLVPSYQPDERLVDLVAGLVAVPGLTVLVVDDGSGPAHAGTFAAVSGLGAEVLTHPENLGKGAALKTGFAHVRRHHPGEPVVCADSDGQHTLLDILRVAAAMDDGADLVLGVRRFTGRVPLRSRLGNRIIAAAFALVTGSRIADTQTGLRGYPHRLLGWLEEIPGDRFEYEFTVLLRASREHLRIAQVEIATVYLRDNASSHFRPLADSVRVLLPLLGYAASSLAGFAVDALLLFVLYPLLGSLAASVVAARLVSASVNFSLNRQLVFRRSRTALWPAAFRYALLAGTILVANLALMELLTPVLGLVAAKVLTETALFLGGYVVQSRLVFRPALRHQAPTSSATPVTIAELSAPVPAIASTDSDKSG
jgi:putative flippase GtrA